MQNVARGGKKTSVDILCDNLCELGLLELKILLKCRVVSREWRGALDHALPLLCLVSFPVGVTGEGAKRTLGLVAGGNLHVVGLALCRKLSARDIEEILKLLDATCPGVREVDITACSDEVILRALAVRALSTLGASPLHVHARLLELAAGTARCPFDAFLYALEAPLLLFDPAFAPAEGAFLKAAAEACIDGNETAVVEAALLLGVSFPVGNQGETRAFDCNQRDHNGRTALHRAAEQGCLLLFALLISAGANLNATDNQDDTPLLLACKKGMLEMATMLKDAGAAINVANQGGDTPLLAAVAAGNLELVKLLVRAGANLAARNKGGMTVLALACVKVGNMEKLSWGGASADEAPPGLAVGRWVRATVTCTTDSQNSKEVSKGSLGKVASFDQNGTAWIDFEGLDAEEGVLQSKFGNISVLSQEDVLKERAQREEVVAMLIAPTQAAGALNEANNEGATPLMHASMRGLCGVVELLLAAGADVATKDKWCKTALDVATNDEVKAALRQHGARHSLFYAAEQGMLELVADLIKEGADVNEQNEAGNTAVERAQNAQTFEVLKAAGATMPEIPGEKKNTLLLEYARKGLTGGVLMALQAGADVNHKDVCSETALHLAARYGHHALAQGLLGAGADVNAKDRDSETALHKAARYGHRALAQGLLGAGADVNAKGSYSETALHKAARYGHRALAQVLLGAGADVNAKDVFGRTPLAFARAPSLRRASSREVEALLRQHGAECCPPSNSKTRSDFRSLTQHTQSLKSTSGSSKDGHSMDGISRPEDLSGEGGG